MYLWNSEIGGKVAYVNKISKYVRIYLVILNFINMKQNKNVEIVLLTLYFKPFWQFSECETKVIYW
jgi:hypothetical protein